MLPRTLNLILAVLLTLPLTASRGVAAPHLARGHPVTAPSGSTHASIIAPDASASTSTNPQTIGRERRVFIVSPTFVGSAFWDPFWAPAYSWGWYGPIAYVGFESANLPGAPANVARLGLHVSPRKADIIIDGSDLGEARDYDPDFHPLWLTPGDHLLELRHPGYQTLKVRLLAVKGEESALHYKLKRGSGLDERSSPVSGPDASAVKNSKI
jgi:hypothetical protein